MELKQNKPVLDNFALKSSSQKLTKADFEETKDENNGNSIETDNEESNEAKVT